MFIAISGNVVYNSLRLSTANTVHMKMCIKYSTYILKHEIPGDVRNWKLR